MSKNLRLLLALLAGMVAALVVTMALEGISAGLFPMPTGLDPHDTAQFIARMKEIPLGAMLMVLGGHLLGTLAGAFTAVRLAPPLMDRGRSLGLVVALLMQGGAAVNIAVIPHPVWFAFGDVVGIGVFAWIGMALAVRT